MAEYAAITATGGNLRGLCPTCERLIHRRVNRANLAVIAGQLDVTVTEASPRIGDTAAPSLNSDFELQGAK